MTPEDHDTNCPLLALENIALQLNGKTLFEDVSWVLGANQNWTVFGPNGSGKSVLAKALCRTVPLTKGRVLFYFDGLEAGPRTYPKPGEIEWLSPETHRSLMRRYASYHQARWQSFEQDAPTVEDYLKGKASANRYQLREDNRPGDNIPQSLWDQALAVFQIEYLLHRKIIHISNGEARKMLIARAMLKAPRLLILDDPFMGLDAASRETLKRALEKMAASGNTKFLLLTSRKDEILESATHLLCVDENKVVYQGPKDQRPEQAQQTPSAASVEKPDFQFPVSGNDPGAGFKTLVDMKNVSISYGGTSVLKNVSWQMKPGERWALLGHNGAGKSTLLSLVLADNPQSYANDISLFDCKRGSGETIWDIKRRIGCVSPESQIYHGPDITCLQAVCSGFFDTVGLYRACSSEQEEIARQWLSGLNMEGLADRSFLSLSTGERRVTLLARALVKNPVLLALDEPCQGLDAKHRARVINIVDRLCEQTSLSMIFISHHMDEMPQSITHILRLENGEVAECGTRQSITS